MKHLLIILLLTGCTKTTTDGIVIEKSFEGTKVGYVVSGKGGTAIIPAQYNLVISVDGLKDIYKVPKQEYLNINVGDTVQLTTSFWSNHVSKRRSW